MDEPPLPLKAQAQAKPAGASQLSPMRDLSMLSASIADILDARILELELNSCNILESISLFLSSNQSM
jgi:hypothetical protein